MTSPGGYSPQEGQNPSDGDPWRPAPPAGFGYPQQPAPGQWPAQYPGQPTFGAPGQGYGPPPPYAPQYAPPQFGAPPYGYPYGVPQTRGTNGLAIASMVVGILWLWWIGSILALIFGYVARSQIKRRNESGGGMAIAGIVLGWIGIGTLLLVIIVAAVNSGNSGSLPSGG